jgi:hypothetical protein
MCCPFCQRACGGVSWKVISPLFLVLWAICSKWSSEIISPDVWLVSSIWSLLSTGQVAIETCGSSLSTHARWSDLLLFSPGNSCISLQLSSSPSKVGQFSFVHCPMSHKVSSAICHTPNHRGGFISPTPLSAFVSHPTPLTGSLVPCPTRILWGWFSFHPAPLSVVDCNSLPTFFSFVQVEGVQSASKMCWMMLSGVDVGETSVVVLTC